MKVAVSVTLDIDYIKKLDAAAKKQDVTRSWLLNKILKDAAERKVI